MRKAASSIGVRHKRGQSLIELFRIIPELLLAGERRGLEDSLALIRVLLDVRSVVVDVQVRELVILLRYLLRLLSLNSIT